MSAYYNEIDAQKAAWLRELIVRGLIAPGDVDERSISDVRADELRGYTQCHFFAGIGIWSYAMRLAGWPDDREAWTGSCPCQPFSAAGKGEAFNDERHLWPVWFPLIKERRPVVCFGEQVSSLDGLAWFDVVHPDLEHADYTVGVLDTCAASVGAPHRRQRLYWVADSASERHDRRRAGETQRWASESERLCDAGRLEDSLRTERRADQRERIGHRETSGRDESADRPRERSEVERLDNATGARSNGQIQGAEGNSRDAARLRMPGERGPVNGFWGSADWVLTRPQRVGDRPGIRPVERGSFPLAHGATARVGRLRGYGDGIVARQAAAFVKAYMDIHD